MLSFAFTSNSEGQDNQDSLDLQFPFREDSSNPLPGTLMSSPLFLDNPSNIQTNIVYDPATNTYEFSEEIGDISISTPTIMSFEEYRQYEMEQAKSRYWKKGGSYDDCRIAYADHVPWLHRHLKQVSC